MQKWKKLVRAASLCAGVAVISMVSTGCSSVTRSAPQAGTGIEVSLDRDDFSLSERVDGTSSQVHYLGGLVMVYDENKVRVLGIKFFEDQYAFQDKGGFLSAFMPISVSDRAYYKALAQTPDADVVAQKAYITRKSGFPVLYGKKTVTFSGKAITFDKD